jgi:hypothetical protein
MLTRAIGRGVVVIEDNKPPRQPAPSPTFAPPPSKPAAASTLAKNSSGIPVFARLSPASSNGSIPDNDSRSNLSNPPDDSDVGETQSHDSELGQSAEASSKETIVPAKEVGGTKYVVIYFPLDAISSCAHCSAMGCGCVFVFRRRRTAGAMEAMLLNSMEYDKERDKADERLNTKKLALHEIELEIERSRVALARQQSEQSQRERDLMSQERAGMMELIGSILRSLPINSTTPKQL